MARSRMLLALLMALLHMASSYPMFRNEIPNGWNVTNPCNPNEFWEGVGHKNKNGGGPRNPFGLDFYEQGTRWTTDLCRMDSDGDGKTNGEELGDPDCVWSKGDTASVTTGITHPGVCDPIDSPFCESKNTFLSCEEFECDAIEEAGIIEHTVKLTETAVPAKVTTYMCQAVDLPSDTDYHIVATKAHKDNENVIHHILLYGCTDDADDTSDLNDPAECFMSTRKGCTDLIAIWAVGGAGMCYHGDSGFRIGLTSYKRAIMELHWDNPQRLDNYRDGSGITLFLTTNLRPFDAGMIMYGQDILIIPPGKESHIINGTCPSVCTEEYMVDSINIVGATNHMHYLGSGAMAYIRHHGSEDITLIAEDEQYDFNSPVFHLFEQPIVMMPGDELGLMCNFRSTSRQRTTYQGLGTNDEMCLSFLMYYPKQNWKQEEGCTAYGPVGPCEWNKPIIAGCEWKYVDGTSPESLSIYAEVMDKCMIGYCLEECKTYTKELMKNPCYDKDLRYILQGSLRNGDRSEMSFILMEFWYKMDSCLAEIAEEQKECDDDGGEVGAASQNVFSPILAVISSLFIAFIFEA